MQHCRSSLGYRDDAETGGIKRMKPREEETMSERTKETSLTDNVRDGQVYPLISLRSLYLLTLPGSLL